MSGIDDADGRRRRMLSALMDGEAPEGDPEVVFRAWREDATCRADWHAWQVIGDVLRREDLANPPARDAALLRAVRARLAEEPVVMAPRVDAVAGPVDERPTGEQPIRVNAPVGGHRFPAARLGGWARAHWQKPVMVAAGFVLATGGLALRTGADAPPARTEALADRPALATPASREQIAPYLAAHRQWTGAASIRMPDDGVRTVSLTRH